jgi:hypothetical protein
MWRTVLDQIYNSWLDKDSSCTERDSPWAAL